MKSTFLRILLILVLGLAKFGVSFGQTDMTGKQVRIFKEAGITLVGELVSDDGREVQLITDKLGKIYIRKDEIEKIELVRTSYEITR